MRRTRAGVTVVIAGYAGYSYAGYGYLDYGYPGYSYPSYGYAGYGVGTAIIFAPTVNYPVYYGYSGCGC
jgi:hypothetical protein